jgi:hypothetical protein
MSDWIHTRNGQIYLRALQRVADALERLASELERRDVTERKARSGESPAQPG